MRFCGLIQHWRASGAAFFNVLLTMLVAGYYFVQAIVLVMGKIFARLLKKIKDILGSY